MTIIKAFERSYAMLFRKKMPRSCSYCQYGTAMEDDQILCIKHGTVSAYYSCRKFRYNPCKRIPPKMKSLDTEKYNDTDFSL